MYMLQPILNFADFDEYFFTIDFSMFRINIFDRKFFHKF